MIWSTLQYLMKVIIVATLPPSFQSTLKRLYMQLKLSSGTMHEKIFLTIIIIFIILAFCFCRSGTIIACKTNLAKTFPNFLTTSYYAWLIAVQGKALFVCQFAKTSIETIIWTTGNSAKFSVPARKTMATSVSLTFSMMVASIITLWFGEKRKQILEMAICRFYIVEEGHRKYRSNRYTQTMHAEGDLAPVL